MSYHGESRLVGLTASDSVLPEWQHPNTIPHKYRSRIPREAAADSRPDSGTGSRLFEVNVWMWRYGRTFPREITVEQAVELRKKRVQESRARAAETVRRRNAAALAAAP